ncbi:MAG: hypothetical protein PHE67_04965 [Campylobacterales bacterium]|nr:hypothetical protein [Campylobacterales bacterium]
MPQKVEPMSQDELNALFEDMCDETPPDEDALNEALKLYGIDVDERTPHDDVADMLEAQVARGLSHLDSASKIQDAVDANAKVYYEKFLSDKQALERCAADLHVAKRNSAALRGQNIHDIDSFKVLMVNALSRYIDMQLGEHDGTMSFEERSSFNQCVEMFFWDLIFKK